MPITRPGAKPVPSTPAPAVAAAGPRRISPKPPNGAAGPAVVAPPITAPTPEPEVSNYEVKETVLQVQRRYAGAENTEEVLEIRTFATRTASISVSAKSRIGSIGQGGEVSVMLTVPCYMEEIDDAKAFASEKVGEYLGAEQERLMELAGPDALAQAGIDVPDLTAPEEGAAEAGEEGAAEGEMTPDDVRAMEDEEALLAFCAANEVQIDMTEYTDLDAAKEAVIAFLWPETEEAAEEADAEAEGEGYTEEELQGMPLADVVAIFPHWNINGGKSPIKARGVSDADHKNRMIAQIMKFQEEAAAQA